MRRLILALLLASPLTAAAQGLLVPSEGPVRALPLKLQNVEVTIVNGAAVTKVDQRFLNPTGRPLEATYVFPVPKGAAVDEFSLWINGQKTKGEVLEKDKAAAIYTDIVRRMQDPGLLEYMGNELFRARVFPVPPSGEQRIEIKYSQVLPYDGGVYHLRYPLGASRSDARPLTKERFVFTAKLSSDVPIKSVYSPTHTIGVARKGEREALVGFEPGAQGEPARDLDLFYTVSRKDVGVSLMTYREEGSDEPGYFLALVSPKQEWQEAESLHKRVTFVVDTSGSMTGDKMPRAKAAIAYCLSRLQPGDRFNVIRFSTDVEPLFPATVEASQQNLDKAQRFVKSMQPLGGTNIDEAMRTALGDGAGAGEGPHLVIFVTDGEPTVGETDEKRIVGNATKANAGGSRIFTFGVGAEINARLLDAMAAEGRGVPEYARDGADFERKISAFYDKLAHPVLSDVSLSIAGADVFDLYPRRLPDLFRGNQLVVLGRYRTPKSTAVVLAGSVGGAERKIAEDVKLPEASVQAPFVPRLWAVRKVGFLLEEIRRNGERAELKNEVIALGTKFGIVTPYTSYLVLEPGMARPNDTLADPRRFDGPVGRSGGAMPDAPMAAAPAAPAAEPAWTEDAKDMGGLGTRGFGAGGGGLGGKGDVAGAPATAARPAKSAPRLDEASGESGIAVSKKLKSMREEEKASDARTTIVGSRTFVERGGVWRDTGAVGAKRLVVKYLSEGYFALLAAKPELKGAFALGERVVVGLPGGRVIEVTPDAGNAGKAEVAAFLK